MPSGPRLKWIIVVCDEALEVYEGTESAANARAYDMWLDSVDQDYHAEPYSKDAAVKWGLEDDDTE